MSGVEFDDHDGASGVLTRRTVRKGAADSVRRYVEEHGGTVPADLADIVECIAMDGGTPLTPRHRLGGIEPGAHQ